MLHDLTPRIFEAALEPEAWWPLLADISAKFGHAPVYLSQARPNAFGSGDIWTAGIDSNVWEDIPETAQNPEGSPVLRRFFASAQGVLLDRPQLLPDRELDRDPIAAAFLKKYGLHHASLSLVHFDEEVASVIWFARPEATPFRARDLTRLKSLLPLFGSAMAVHRRLRDTEAISRGLKGALDQLEDGALLLDQRLKVYYHNAAAEAVLAAQGPLRNARGYLRARHWEDQQRMLHLAAQADQAASAELPFRCIIGPSGPGDISLEMSFVAAIGAGRGTENPGASIIAFLGPLQRPPGTLPPDILASLFGLTPAEGSVAQCAARAHSPTEIAELLGMSRNTVKSHLKSIYSKLDVHSQAELVLRLVARS